ncbi:transposable element Tcb1 transposase [Trichonephila clavipes]|nr:transposable element Tcb1 transposase [Trichonephila clavipes]
MALRRFRRRYEPLLQFERERIIGMVEAGWSARRVTRQLGRFDCVVRRCWDQGIREMSFTRRPGSGHPRQISRREDRHIIRNTRVQLTAPLATIQAQVAPSLGAPVSSRTIPRRLAGHLGSRRPLRVSLTSTHRRRGCRARGNRNAAEWNQVVFSEKSRFNLSSDDNRVWRPRGECLKPAFALQQHVPQLVEWSHFSTRQCSDSHGKGVTRLPPYCYYPSLACLIPRFVSNRAYLGSFETVSWASHEFERTRVKVTANMERNVSRHHTELVCLNARSHRIVHSR